MPRIYDDNDLRFTRSGDYVISGGDLQDTSHDWLLSLVQEIQTVCKSVTEDWEMYPNIGASIDDFVGERNSRETAEKLKQRLRLSIVSLGLVDDPDLSITIVPIHRTEILGIISVEAMATPLNFLEREERLVVHFIYNYLEKGSFYLLEHPEVYG